jgi:hypothetical protein
VILLRRLRRAASVPQSGILMALISVALTPHVYEDSIQAEIIHSEGENNA